MEPHLETGMEIKHSGLGIASFITSLVAGLCLLITIVIAGVLEATTPGGMDEDSLAAIAVGLSILAFLCMSLAALGLGIGGLFHKERKKTFAIIGTVFSAVTIIGTTALIVLGLMIG